VKVDFHIIKAPWNSHQQELRLIRTTVFIEEQGVPAALEWDEADANTYHVLALDNNNQPIGCGRLKTDGHIGRMAVLKNWRNRGVGSAILSRLLDQARKSAMPGVYLHAQTSALGFYQKHGFEISGDEFIDAGIPHRTMHRSLV